MESKRKLSDHILLILSAVAVIMAATNLFCIRQYNQAVSLGISIALILFSIMLIIAHRLQDKKDDGEEPDPVWIPCKDKLPIMNGPNDNTLYIVTRRGHVGCSAFHYGGDGKWIDDNGMLYRDVVAWRFMPQVYDLRARVYESAKAASADVRISR